MRGEQFYGIIFCIQWIGFLILAAVKTEPNLYLVLSGLSMIGMIFNMYIELKNRNKE